MEHPRTEELSLDLAAQAELEAATRFAPCPCGVSGVAMWRRRNMPWGPASLIGALILASFGVLAVVADLVPWIGWVVLGVVAASVVGSLVYDRIQGHRRWCWLVTGTWRGLAVVGVPVRVILSFGLLT
ncbi:MAG: hypothetical protein ACR2MB_05515 [Acidimicrobiales bacterium]